MNELKIFENQEFGKIRTVIKDGDVWFVGKDIAEILGYYETNDMTRWLEDDEKETIKDFDPEEIGVSNKVSCGRWHTKHIYAYICIIIFSYF